MADQAAISDAMLHAGEQTFGPSQLQEAGLAAGADGRRRSVLDLLAMGPDRPAVVGLAPWMAALPARVALHLETEARYRGYLGRQASEIRQLSAETAMTLPALIDYAAIGGLSTEMRERLQQARPPNFSAAQRVPGITPAALTALMALGRAACCFT